MTEPSDASRPDHDSGKTPNQGNIDDEASSQNTIRRQHRRAHRQRVALVGITVIMTVCWTGAFFGWGPMQLLLEEEGAFEEECSLSVAVNGTLPCPAQTTKLLNVHFYAQLTLLVSPIFGIWVDSYGPFCMMCLSTVFMVVGLGSLALAVAQGIDWLLYPSFFFVGLCTISTHQNIMQLGILFQGKTQQRVISAMNSLFDAGALTYLGLWAVKRATGISLEMLIGGYLMAGIFFFGAALYFWFIVSPASSDESDQVDHDTKVDDPTSQGQESHVPRMDDEFEEEQAPQLVSNIDHASLQNDPISIELEDGTMTNDTAINAEQSENQALKSSSDTERILGTNDNYVLIAERPTLQQLISKQFVLLLIFFAFHSAHNVFTLTTARDFLAYLGDDATGNRYLSIFVLLTPVSILGLPFMDYILNHYGYHAGLQSINLLALSYGIVKVSSESLPIQVLGFLLFSMFRCFMFTVTFSFLPTFLGGNVVGRGAGIMVLSQGISSLINVPLASWAVKGLDGNFFLPNLLYTVAIIPFFWIAWLLGAGVRKEASVSAEQAAAK